MGHYADEEYLYGDAYPVSDAQADEMYAEYLAQCEYEAMCEYSHGYMSSDWAAAMMEEDCF